MSLPRNGIKQFKNKMAGLADDLAALKSFWRWMFPVL